MGIKLLIFAALALSGQLSFASSTNPDCTNLVKKIEDFDLNQGQGWRGFLSPEPAYTPETASAAAARNMMYWRQPVYVARSLEDIAYQDAIQNNILIKGMYIIGKPLTVEQLELSNKSKANKQPTPVEIQRIFWNAAKRGVYWVDYEGIDVTSLETMKKFADDVKAKRVNPLLHARIKQIDPKFVHENFNLEKLFLTLDVARGEAPGEVMMGLMGWFAPRYRGVLKMADTDPATSNTYKNIEAEARSYYKKGYRFKFSTDYKAALDLLAVQERSEPHLETGKHLTKDPSTNRYADEAYRKSQLDIFNKGNAFSGEAWGPDNKLIAGFIGTIKGNHYSPDSIFYDKNYFTKQVTEKLTEEEKALPEKQREELINRRSSSKALSLAKITMRAAAQRLHEAGIAYLEAGMVTNFTNTMNAMYVPRVEHEKLDRLLPKEVVTVDLKSEWVPIFPEPPTKKSKN